MSALATIFGSLGELSESELRQLYLSVGVRLGIPDVPAGAKPQKDGGRKSSNTAKKKGGKASASSTSSKGNPQRKSQWANHPLYIEYSRLKKVVEAQAKDAKTSFNGVDTAESRAYRQAFTQWVEAKSSFRAHGDGATQSKTEGKKEDSEDESEEEEEPRKAAPPPQRQVKPASPPGDKAGPSGKSTGSPPPAAAAGKAKSPPRK